MLRNPIKGAPRCGSSPPPLVNWRSRTRSTPPHAPVSNRKSPVLIALRWVHSGNFEKKIKKGIDKERRSVLQFS